MKKIKAVLLLCLFACLVLVVSCDGIITITPKPDTTDPANPDSSNPDSSNPDSSNPDSSNPDSSNPDSSNPDPSNPDTPNPDPSNPDTPLPPGSAGTSKDNPIVGSRDELLEAYWAINLYFEIIGESQYEQYLSTTTKTEGNTEISEEIISQCNVTYNDEEYTLSGTVIATMNSEKNTVEATLNLMIDKNHYTLLLLGPIQAMSDSISMCKNGVWYQFEGGMAPEFPLDASEKELTQIYRIIDYANLVLAEEYPNLSTRYESDSETRIIAERTLLDSDNIQHTISGTVSVQPDTEEGRIKETYDFKVDDIEYSVLFIGTPPRKEIQNSSYSALHFSIDDKWYVEKWSASSDPHEYWHNKGLSLTFPKEATSDVVAKLKLINGLHNLLNDDSYQEYVSVSQDGSTVTVSECKVTFEDVTYTVSSESIFRSYVSVDRAYSTINMTIDGTKYYTLAKGTASAQDDRLFCYTDNCWYYLTPSEIV